jgi:Ca2+-binding RTX toxin-like protein
MLSVVVMVVVVRPPWLAADTDGDLVDDAVDLCPEVADPYQADHDGDGIGDLCDDSASAEPTDGDDLLLGSGEVDEIDGLAGDDHVYGFDGNDTLSGGPGSDFLDGGDGDDTSTGGPGCDVFTLDPRSNATDVATDFTPGEDRFTVPPLDEDPSDDLLEFVVSSGDDGVSLAFTFDSAQHDPGTGGRLARAIDTTPCPQPAPAS